MQLFAFMSTPQATNVGERLRSRRRALLTRYRDVQALADDEVAEREIEQMDAATEQWDAQVLSRLGDRDIRELSALDAALARVSAGTYGRCLRCDEPIEPGRLAVLPEASLCAECSRS
jgi:RNA polymerase-binding transcription factor DksA